MQFIKNNLFFIVLAALLIGGYTYLEWHNEQKHINKIQVSQWKNLPDEGVNLRVERKFEESRLFLRIEISGDKTKVKEVIEQLKNRTLSVQLLDKDGFVLEEQEFGLDQVDFTNIKNTETKEFALFDAQKVVPLDEKTYKKVVNESVRYNLSP